MEVFKGQGNDTEVLWLIWMISILSESKVAIEGIPIQIEKIMFFVVFKIQLMNACGNIVEERISNLRC